MDITPQDEQQQPISDDQELAKALAGVVPDVPEPIILDTPAAISAVPDPSSDTAAALPPLDTTAGATPAISTFASTSTASSATDLESIKKDALGELRPLIDRVDLPAEEKFDTYLLLIRSTDDSSLVAAAHAAAQGISDEKRRAEALLDIIKEIDYLSRGSQPAA